MENAHLFIKRVTGRDFVYPGHPLVLATVVMMAYPDFASANKTAEDFQFSEALGDNRIPGAGCHVGAAMSTLKIGSEGGTADEMVAYAVDYWDRGQAGGHVKYVPGGQAQAKAMEPHFRELAAVWFAPKSEAKPGQMSEQKPELDAAPKPQPTPRKPGKKMAPVEHHRRIRLRGGIEFDVVFIKRSSSLVVVRAEGRKPMRVRHVLMHGQMTWAARVDGTGFTAYHANPAKAFETCARHSWRKPSGE